MSDTNTAYASSATPTRDVRWSATTRVAFRFAFVYWLLYFLPFPADIVAMLGGVVPTRFAAVPRFAATIIDKWQDIWAAIVIPVGRHVFRTDITVMPNGSGDTTFNYVQLCCFVAIALILTITWTLLDRRRLSYPRLHHWLRVYVRFALAMAMLSYGAAKVIQSQFPPPTTDRLIQPFGDASPMGLLWTFMGASRGYNIFTGLAEVLGGVLLTSRRTTLAGALVSGAAMTHIFVLNLCYDVPVKLYSFHLLVAALFLVLPFSGLLINLFLLNRPVVYIPVPRLFPNRWLHITAIFLRTAGVIALVAYMIIETNTFARNYAAIMLPVPALHGLWNVEEFVVDGDKLSTTSPNDVRWRRVVFETGNVFAVQFMNDSRTRWSIKPPVMNREIELTSRANPLQKSVLEYELRTPETLTLDGQLDGKKIHASLARAPTPEFRLTSRGFHWINEYPFNR